MKTVILVLLILGIAVARLNLPENNVAESYKPQQQGGVVGELTGRLLFSEAVADWQYQDFLVVKFACSERLKLKLIALPFKPWQEHERDIQTCGF